MIKKLNIGDKVKHRDEKLEGIILSLTNSHAEIILKDGFTERILLSKLVLDSSFEFELDDDITKNQSSYVEIRPEKIMELDLHIEHIAFDWKRIPPNKILDRQITTFHEEMRTALKENYDKLIVIHGKGKGILKKAIIHELSRYPMTVYQDCLRPSLKNAAIEISLNRE